MEKILEKTKQSSKVLVPVENLRQIMNWSRLDIISYTKTKHQHFFNEKATTETKRNVNMEAKIIITKLKLNNRINRIAKK